jgi:hypothetical protein
MQGETCLESGLCYGAIGLVYRGACANIWDSGSCLTYCEDSMFLFCLKYESLLKDTKKVANG